MENNDSTPIRQILFIVLIGGLFLYALIGTLLSVEPEYASTTTDATAGAGVATAVAPAGPDIAQFVNSPNAEAQAYGQSLQQGKEVFENNCVQCHAINEQIVGPALKGITERRQMDWLVNFIKYPEKVIQSGDPYAVELYEKYKQYMPNHDFLSDGEIKSIIEYVEAHTSPKSFEG